MQLTRLLREYLKPLHGRAGLHPDAEYTALVGLYMKLQAHGFISEWELDTALAALLTEFEDTVPSNQTRS